MQNDLDTKENTDELLQYERPFLMGKVSAVVNSRKSAKAICDEIVEGAVERLNAGNGLLVSKSKI